MRRVQLFEFNEHPRVPDFLRAWIVESLGLGLRWGHTLDGLAPVLARFLEECGADRVLDLCSGSGEPAALLVEALLRQGIRPPRMVLSDLLPDGPALAAAAARHPQYLEVAPVPVDATAVPPEVDAGRGAGGEARTARILVNGFHHFPPDVARGIVRDAMERGRGLFIVESFPRNPLLALPFLPWGYGAMVSLPFRERRDRWLRLALLLPVHFVAAWDLFVSVFRMHTPDEVRAMAGSCASYRWTFLEVPYPLGGRLQVFQGVPTTTSPDGGTSPRGTG